MVINRLFLKENVPSLLEEEIDFSSYPFDPFHIKGIPFCKVNITATDYGDGVMAKFNITADVIGTCIYSLEEVPLHINVEEEIYFTEDESDDTNYHIEGNEIPVDAIVLALIFNKLPRKIIKKGAKLPDSGNGYRVIKEDELIEEKKNKTDPRWDKLDELDLD